MSPGRCSRPSRDHCTRGGPASKAGDLGFDGLRVIDGRVKDTVTVVCDRRPERHYLQVWIEYRAQECAEGDG